MADTANAVLAANNMFQSISVVHKDARYLTDSDLAAGTADLAVFEVSTNPAQQPSQHMGAWVSHTVVLQAPTWSLADSTAAVTTASPNSCHQSPVMLSVM